MTPDPDAGEPIRMLAGQEVETSSGFLRRVRGKIHRRTAVSQFAVYSWDLPRVVLMDLEWAAEAAVVALEGSS